MNPHPSISDPVSRFEHSHSALTKLVESVAGQVRSRPESGPPYGRELRDPLQLLRDELLRHFAAEEEGLFPFLRSNLHAVSDVVDSLASAHDAICGAVVRLAHLAETDRHVPPGALRSQFERFEVAYAEHSRREAALFDELARTLGSAERQTLAEILRGL